MLAFTRPIFWFSIVVISITASCILLSAWWIGKQYSHEVAQEQISRADYYLQSFLQSQGVLQTTSVKGIITDFGFKNTIADGDPATISSMLENHAKRVDLDLILVLNRDGSAIADNSPLITKADIEQVFTILKATPDKPMMLAIQNGFYRLYLSPIKAPHVIAYAISGNAIDIHQLEDIKSITGLDLTLHSKQRGYFLSTSTLARKVIQNIDQKDSRFHFWKREHFINKQIDIETPPPFDVELFMSADLSDFHEKFDHFVITLLIISLFLVLLIMLLSMILSRHIFSPLQRLHKKLLRRASYDHLTGIHNRITASELSYRLLIECYRTEKPILVTLLDIDHFKTVNDKYGHAAGDAILQEVAKRLQQGLRDYDVVGRYGGEEFIVASSVSYKTGEETLLRLKNLISEKPFIYKDKLILVTISLGACFIDFGTYARMLTPEELVEWADRGLYSAKENGRNRVVINTYKHGTLEPKTLT